MEIFRCTCFFTVASISLVSTYAEVGTELDPKIVGGKHVPIEEVPYQAQLLSDEDEDTICGAAIISDYWLVSAAHCFAGTNFESLSITTGAIKNFSGNKHEIEKYIIHPNYSWYNKNDNDISLIKLKSPIQFGKKQRSIRLAIRPPKVGDVMKISGYGWESFRSGRALLTRYLKEANVTVVDQIRCAKSYSTLFTEVTVNSFCAGHGGSGSCSTDSGGPGVIGGRLAGIVSGGYHCNTAYFPGIYTRVDLYRRWIAEQTGVSV